MSRGLLLGELEFLHKNLHVYLNLWPEGQQAWRPAPGIFTLFDLTVHLCATPSATAAILAGEPDEVIFGWDRPLQAGGVEDLRDLLDRGMRRVTDLLNGYPDEAFVSKPIPHPFGEPATPERHLLSLITHIHHHRGQLHNYLRQLGAAVDTGTLYTAE